MIPYSRGTWFQVPQMYRMSAGMFHQGAVGGVPLNAPRIPPMLMLSAVPVITAVQVLRFMRSRGLRAAPRS